MLNLVPATDDDKAYVLTLRKLTMTEHLESSGLFLDDKEHLRRINLNYEHQHLIYKPTEKGPILVGATQFANNDDHVKLVQIQVHPDFQNQGIGADVITALKEKAQQSHKPLRLTVLKTNRAKGLYEKLGFQQYGEDDLEYWMEWLS